MTEIPYNDNPALSHKSKQNSLSKTRIWVFVLEIGFILILLIGWLSSKTLHNSKNLWVLFFYSFPSQFLIAIVPHEPVFFYFSKFYAPLVVTIVSVSSTILTEILNYSAFKFVVDLKSFQKFKYGGFVQKLVKYFNKAPFTALWIAGFTPVPFYPFRFLVVLAHYSLAKYILAVFLSRTPRFFLLAILGYAIKIPDYLLIAIFIGLIIIANYPIIKNLVNKNRNQKN